MKAISPPSRSLGKATLLITPLFACILALIMTTSDLSYLFILQFTDNVASDSDINLIASTRHTDNSPQFYDQMALNQMRKDSGFQTDNSNASSFVLPLVDLREVSKWLKTNNASKVVRGFSPRWMFPAVIESTTQLDSILLALDINNERGIGLGQRAAINDLNAGQVAVSTQIAHSLDVGVGSQITLSFELKNLFSAGKMLQKYSDQQSRDEYIPSTDGTDIFSAATIKNLIEKVATQYGLSAFISEKDIQRIYQLLTQKFQYTVKIGQVVESEGAWPSSIHNVVVLDLNEAKTVIEEQVLILLKDEVTAKLPWPLAKTVDPSSILLPAVREALESFAPMVAVTLKDRPIYYSLHEKVLHEQLTAVLQKTPDSIEVLSTQPLYKVSLGIKYFFDSILQIFGFISALLYVNVMRIVLKQAYDQKEIEVGIWRTLGVGGVKVDQKDQQHHLLHRLAFKDMLGYQWRLLASIGHLPYWFATTSFGWAMYLLLKWLLTNWVIQRLHYSSVSLHVGTSLLLFVGILVYTQISCVVHMMRIFSNSIVESMKPFKRTFDVVKVRVIKMSTFGLEAEVLLIAVMLIYYGLVSYYFIPRAVLYSNDELQTILFNSIFFFMIFGAIMLCTVLQSTIQILILTVLFVACWPLRRLKSAVLKNIQAKRYTNLKVSLSIALIFAFVLFFTSGVQMEIKLIQSFIKRGLGSDLTLQNYEQGLNRTKLEAYLNTKGYEYTWLTSDINHRTSLKFELIDPRKMRKTIDAGLKVFAPTLMNTSYSQYYVPDQYITNQTYSKIPGSSYKNGLDTIYNPDTGASVGGYDPSDTFTVPDKHSVLSDIKQLNDQLLPQNEQVVHLAISNMLKKRLGCGAGCLTKLIAKNTSSYEVKHVRVLISHVMKALPGFQMLFSKSFASESQGQYLLDMVSESTQLKFVKIMVKNTEGHSTKQIASALLALAPPHTQMNQISFVSSSFSLLQKVLNGYITLLSLVMNCLSIMLLFLYTRNKCRQQTEIYKILRSVGTPVTHVRLSVFAQVFVRVLTAVTIGIVLGVLFSISFARQVESILLIQMSAIELGGVLTMGAVLMVLFSVTVLYSTQGIQKQTIAQMSRK